MLIKPVILTKTDQAILDSYIQMMEGLSHYLGDHYEIVLHSLADIDHSVIKIINGYHTGRKVGAPITDLALRMLARIEADPDNNGDIVYFNRNRKGEPLKSATILVRGEKKQIIGLLCMNCYLNTSLWEVVNNLVPTNVVGFGGSEYNKMETFTDDIDEMVGNAIEQARGMITGDRSIAANMRHKEIISILLEQGIFNLKNSVQKVATALGISRNTVYLHLRNLQQGEDNERSS